MASTGQVVVNAATSERLVFQTLARDSAGELLRLDAFFAPGSRAWAMHVHPHQEERFEILDGSLRFRVGRETKVARAGDVIVVPAGTPHLPSNVGETEAHCVAEFRPAAALGRIRPGQAARLRLEGFPWVQYGSLAARVSRVGSELRDGRIRVELDVPPQSSSRIPLQHGLPGAVEIEVERVAPATLLLRLAGRLVAGPRASGAVGTQR